MARGSSLIRGDALHIPLRTASVDLIVTSPPYFALRSYQDDGEHYDGQIGSEPTPADFLAALWAVTDELWRVLKPTGSLFVNLGDKYAGSGGHNNANITPRNLPGQSPKAANRATYLPTTTRNAPDHYNQSADVPTKSLMGLPWRYALGLTCPDQYRPGGGPRWTLRAEIIWSKPNCLSGGTVVYAKVKCRPTAIKVHDLCRTYAPEDVQLWNGTRWTQVVWWQPTGRHEDAAESYKAIRAARRRGDEPVVAGDVEIELRSGERIGCTREHRWPTRRGLVHTADLVVGDIIDTAPLPEGEATPFALDDETIGWFVGLYIAEGSRSGTTIQIAGHVNETARYKRLCELAAAFHGNCAVHHTKGNTATINLTGRFLDAILDTYVGGRTAKDKHLRPACWQRSNRFLRAVLDGYLSGDGHHEAKADRWILGFTDNDALASDLRTLGARLGISVRLRRTTHTGFGKEWPGWGGSILMDPTRRRQPDSQVVAIRQSRARQFWDIGVADDPHLFALGSGVLTHNSLPESVTDRVRRSHEQWFHLTKQGRYFAAVDEVREAQRDPHRSGPDSGSTRRVDSGVNGGFGLAGKFDREYNPLGKLPGSVWTIPSEPLQVPDDIGVDHFAAFPQEWPRRLILGWTPSGICTACGEGRRPVVDKKLEGVWHDKPVQDTKFEAKTHRDDRKVSSSSTMNTFGHTEATITGYACACDVTLAPTTPAVVLDPFVGTGTVPMVARALGRYGVGLDLSRDYLRLADWRINQSRHGAKSTNRTNRERQGNLW